LKIETIKDLKAVADLCRKQGITSINVDGVTMVFGDAPQKTAHTPTDDKIVDETTSYTDDDLIEWSSRGI
jgi:hypothetical protein